MSVIGPYAKATTTIKNSSDQELLTACDEALNDQLEVVKEQQALIEQLKIASQIKQERVLQLEKDASMWYNKGELTLFIGLSLGLIAGGIIAK